MVNPGLTIFLVFFGISLLDALSGGHWLRGAFWILIGVAFWALDRMRHRRPAGADGKAKGPS